MCPPLPVIIPPRLLNLILASLLVATFFSLTRFPPTPIHAYTQLSAPEISQNSSPQHIGKTKEDLKEKPDEDEPIQPFDPEVDGTNLFFNDEQCEVKFVGLFTEIDMVRYRGGVGEAPYRDGDPGFVRARIYNGQLYIVAIGDDIEHRMSALLHQINRALITAPIPTEIPNIEFQLAVGDYPVANTWSLTRRDDPDAMRDTWLVPDYSFWSRLEPQIGSYAEIRERIDNVDRDLPWAEKSDLAVWRGTIHRNGRLRGKLMEVAKGKSWSDVAELDWKTNALRIEDFCRYKFLIYTEGITYSDRLRYFQHCRSVIIAPALRWRQYHSPLIFSEGPKQNYVKVNEDWSDLQETVRFYLENPYEAERIANNSVRMFRDHYSTPAGEVCYWRRLFKSWGSVTDDPGPLTLEERGRSWESFVLMGKLDWETIV